jgi:hypothetical protein
MSATTKDKLIFVAAMSRHTSATVRQCEALMRFAHTFKQVTEWAAIEPEKGAAYDRKRLRIANRILNVCNDIGPTHVKVPHGRCPHCKHYGEDCTGRNESLTKPVFEGAVLTISVPGGEGIVVPS